jgi:hypothetical protein
MAAVLVVLVACAAPRTHEPRLQASLAPTADTGAVGAARPYGCAALMCEDELLLRLALRAVVDKADVCSDGGVFVLSTLYWAPMTAVGDAVAGRPIRFAVPRSPAAMSIQDIAMTFYDRHAPLAVVKIDSIPLLRRTAPTSGCVVVLSPPAHRPEGMLVRAGVWGVSPEFIAEYFVILARDSNGWRVLRTEVGMQS